MKKEAQTIFGVIRFVCLSSVITFGLMTIACTEDTDYCGVPWVPNPRVEGPITGGLGSPWISSTNFDLSEVGYLQQEYFISGTARAYRNVGELNSDGIWHTETAGTAPYKTRIVIYRPNNPQNFNGTVVVEWLNVSGGLDAAPDWTMAHTELIREGYAWAGVSAQFAGVEGGFSIPGLGDLSLKGFDPERYGSLNHPGDSFSYDIFSQAGQAIHCPVGVDPLNGLRPRTLIAIGESQSAGRLMTYVNAIDPIVQIYEGYLIHSRYSGSAPLSESPEPAISTPRVVRIRASPSPGWGLGTSVSSRTRRWFSVCPSTSTALSLRLLYRRRP